VNAPDNPAKPPLTKKTDKVVLKEIHRLAGVMQEAVQKTMADVKADAGEIAKQQDSIDAEARCMRCCVDKSEIMTPEQLDETCLECQRPFALRKPHVHRKSGEIKVHGNTKVDGRDGDGNACRR